MPFKHRVAGSSPARLTMFIINNLQGSSWLSCVIGFAPFRPAPSTHGLGGADRRILFAGRWRAVTFEFEMTWVALGEAATPNQGSYPRRQVYGGTGKPRVDCLAVAECRACKTGQVFTQQHPAGWQPTGKQSCAPETAMPLRPVRTVPRQRTLGTHLRGEVRRPRILHAPARPVLIASGISVSGDLHVESEI